MARARTAITIVALLAGGGGSALAQTVPPNFEIIDLAELIPGATDSAAFDISPGGMITGTVRVDLGDTRVAVWTASTGTVLDSIFGSEWAQAISDDGVIVGQYLGTAVGFYYRDGIFDCIPLPDPCGSFNNIWRASAGTAINRFNVFTGAISPPADEPQNQPVQAYLGSFDGQGNVVTQRLGTYLDGGTFGSDLNDDGVVVGVAGSSLERTALLFRGGTVEALPDLGGEYNWAEGINNAGFAVGIASEPGATTWPYPADGLLWNTNQSPITFEVLGRLPDAQQTRPLAINELNTVVGASVDASLQDQRAILWRAGQLYDLNQLIPAGSGWHLELANAINDSGEIVGYGRRDGIPGRRAFLLRPAGGFEAGFDGGHLGEWSAHQQ